MKKLVPLLFLAAVIAGSAIVGALAATWYWQRESEPEGIAEFEDNSLEITVYTVDDDDYRPFAFELRNQGPRESLLDALARSLREGRGVLGTGPLPQDKRPEVARRLQGGIQRGSQSSNSAACFNPRHVILAHRSGNPVKAWMICFECVNYMEVTHNSPAENIHNFRPEDGLDTLLNAAVGKR